MLGMLRQFCMSSTSASASAIDEASFPTTAELTEEIKSTEKSSQEIQYYLR